MTKKIIIVLLFMSGLLFGIIFYGLYDIDNLTEKRMEKIINAVNEYYLKENSYPKNFDEFLRNKNIDKVVRKVIWSNEIKWTKYEEAAIISYYQKPIGPFRCYDFEKNEFYFEE